VRLHSLQHVAFENLAAIENCGAEIGTGPYQQTAAENLADPDRFDRLKELMAAVLNHLAGAA
jgi:hypothetical protein